MSHRPDVAIYSEARNKFFHSQFVGRFILHGGCGRFIADEGCGYLMRWRVNFPVFALFGIFSEHHVIDLDGRVAERGANIAVNISPIYWLFGASVGGASPVGPSPSAFGL